MKNYEEFFSYRAKDKYDVSVRYSYGVCTICVEYGLSYVCKKVRRLAKGDLMNFIILSKKLVDDIEMGRVRLNSYYPIFMPISCDGGVID